MKVFVDGASKGNPGLALICYWFFGKNGTNFSFCGEVGRKTSNVAEYTAVLFALQFLESNYERYMNDDNKITVISDSRLVVEQICGEYRTKEPTLKKYHDMVLETRDRLIKNRGVEIRIVWVDRQKNLAGHLIESWWKIRKKGEEKCLITYNPLDPANVDPMSL